MSDRASRRDHGRERLCGHDIARGVRRGRLPSYRDAARRSQRRTRLPALFPWDGPAAPLPAGVVAVVHCAYDLRARDRAEIERVNLRGTDKLIRAVRLTFRSFSSRRCPRTRAR